jgi:NAD/NADP transhydrogenase alpha subunit
MTYDVPWETMANCIQARWVDIVVVTPQYNQRNRTAVLTLTMQGLLAPGSVVGEYAIRQGGNEDRSEVSFRRRRSVLGSDTDGRQIADRCARSA